MEFHKLMKLAEKNSAASKEMLTKEKKLSENIKKFLQKREKEDRERQLQQRKEAQALMALRDEKSKTKIRTMLKVTKSANKSGLAEDTAWNGVSHSVQDDFGHVSKEAEAFYAKYMEKVSHVKVDKGFAPSHRPNALNLDVTKKRVQEALLLGPENKENRTQRRQPNSSSSSSSSTSSKKCDPTTIGANKINYATLTRYDHQAERKQKEGGKAAAAPMDFKDLIKLANKIQHEPVAETQKKTKESERPLTLKQKLEAEEQKRWKDERAQRELQRAKTAKAAKKAKKSNNDCAGIAAAIPAPIPTAANKMTDKNGAIPKLNQAPEKSKTAAATTSAARKTGENGLQKPKIAAVAPAAIKNAPSVKSCAPSSFKQAQQSTSVKKPTSAASVTASASVLPKKVDSASVSKNPYAAMNKRAFNGPTREFPPADVRRPNAYNRRPAPANKRRILDDEDDSEYDSEMDDFIDDDDAEEDYSAAIKSIFGYDKSKYRHLDEEDDRAMESTFAQQQREEFLSKKAAVREDLEDMQKEAIEKKAKRSSKKRRLH